MSTYDKGDASRNNDGNEEYDFDFRRMRFGGRNPGKETHRLLIKCMIFFVVVVFCFTFLAIAAKGSIETFSVSILGSALFSFFIGRVSKKDKMPP
jgi:hypothetical protein